MKSMRVLVDAGNTRLKWAVVDDGVWREQGSAGYAELEALRDRFDAAAAVYIASVTTAANEACLEELLAPSGVKAKWLRAEAQFLDLKNSYADPGQLGVDRWMGLIAARARAPGAVLVVSVGTAMTVDALGADGTFLGGLIVPGVFLMRQALRQGTARVAGRGGAWQAFPQSTADGVESGIVAALCGAILQQHTRLSAVAGLAPRCLLTGGDAVALLPFLPIAVEHVPFLVLEGINRVAEEETTR
jgi:type III pantothenate kinase